VTRSSPLVETSVTLAYQAWRGFLRNFCAERSITMSKVHFTSAAVNGLPSCQLTPGRRRKASLVPSAFHSQPVASSGTMPSIVFCGLCWSNSTRLLNTAMNGALIEKVASSWIEALAGLSR
jgi:hypothetical protein